MRVLQFHNRQLAFGGADVVLNNERTVLEEGGHEVRQIIVDSESVLVRRTGLANAAAKAVWNTEAKALLDQAISTFSPDLIHFHTVFPIASPAVLRTAKDHRLPSVMTHHSYRASCVASMLMRDGRSCTDCVGKQIKWDAVANRCYRSSLPASATLGTSALVHRLLKSWDGVTVHIALSEFGRRILHSEFGSGTTVTVSPNFVVTSGQACPDPPSGKTEDALLFLGRLTPSKGLLPVLRLAAKTGVKLTIVGDGPLREIAGDYAEAHTNIDYPGPVNHEQVPEIIRSHAGLVFASTWAEACPMSILESYAQNRPVLVPDAFPYSELVTPGVTGEHFSLSSTDSFTQAAEEFIYRSRTGHYAQIEQHFCTHYSRQAGLARLEACYGMAVDLHR